ncbi:hypothetical protein KY359_00265 [Candidatus Woesearchaeota archaeon]|nr:hypothetical protein [Candidatus Woesearchaeota archaeon]
MVAHPREKNLEYFLSCSGAGGGNGREGGGDGGRGGDCGDDDDRSRGDDVISGISSGPDLDIAGYDEDNDALAERIIELADTYPSNFALHLGKFMLRNRLEERLVKYAVDTLDLSTLSGRKKRWAAALLRKWTINNLDNSCPDTRLCEASNHRFSRMARLKAVAGSIENMVSSKDMYVLCSRLMQSQMRVYVPSFDEDIVSLSSRAPVLPQLPPEVGAFFQRVVDDSLKFNASVAQGQRRRYNNLGRILESLEPYTGNHDSSTYPLLEKVKHKDRRNILFEIYSHLGSIPRGAPQNIAGVLDAVLDFLPEDGVQDDDDVKKVTSFIKRVAESFEVHEPFEVGCFLELCRQRYEDSREVLKGFDAVGEMLHRSTMARNSDAYRTERRDCFLLEDRIQNIGREYLELSRQILRDHSRGAASRFAKKVLSFNSLALGPQRVLEDMELYKRGVIDRIHIGEKDSEKLASALLRERTQTTRHTEMRRRYAATVKDGAVDCPDHLKAHLLNEFGVEVDKIWDFRKNQLVLYAGREAIDAYNALVRRKTDPADVIKVANDLHGRGLLERHISYEAGGCGQASAEIAFYEELRRLGYDVHLNLVDWSEEMRKAAILNCEMRGIDDAGVSDTDLEKLNLKDLMYERQVILSLFGGTFFNWIDRYSVARRYHNIFRKRDDISSGGKFRVKRHFPGERQRDVLLIDGDLVKDVGFYMSWLSKLFLAKGLSGGDYELTEDMLRDAGGNLKHTLYLDYGDELSGTVLGGGGGNGDVELQCIYLITKSRGKFRENEAILVIDSGTMNKDELELSMGNIGFSSYFVDGKRDRATAVCTTLDGIVDDCAGNEGQRGE